MFGKFLRTEVYFLILPKFPPFFVAYFERLYLRHASKNKNGPLHESS